MENLPSTDTKPALRLRVFAGPNGSGKSTIIHAVKNLTVNGKPIDFGAYINADDIARQLRQDDFSIKPFHIEFSENDFVQFASLSGLLQGTFDKLAFVGSFEVKDRNIICLNKVYVEHLAQIIARFLREELLKQGKRFSFETVFSHPSNLDIMKRAAAMGYKVYLYFVSTESSDINKYRVKLRVQKGGHQVPEDKIESRYLRSLELLYDAAQIAYQAFFFDNSVDGKKSNLFSHFKQVDGEKQWEQMEKIEVPNWFLKYYSEKVKRDR